MTTEKTNPSNSDAKDPTQPIKPVKPIRPIQSAPPPMGGTPPPPMGSASPPPIGGGSPPPPTSAPTPTEAGTNSSSAPPSLSEGSIGIWGPSQVGKTTYLAGALSSLSTDGWIWYGQNDAAHSFINRQVSTVEGGKFLKATEEGTPTHYSFQVIKKGDLWGRTGRHHQISLLDAAGVQVEDEFDTFGYFESLRRCLGLLLMIDPKLKNEDEQAQAQQSGKTYSELLATLIQNLQEIRTGAEIDMPLAICLTKIDQPEHWPFRDDPEQHLFEILGRPTFDRLKNTFSNREYFAISMVGVYEDPATGHVYPNIDPTGTRIADMRAWQPYKILDPLFWLFDQIELHHNRQLTGWRQALRKQVRQPNYQKDK